MLSVAFGGQTTPAAIRPEVLINRSYGRIRDVVEGPDGYIYFSTSNRDGRNATPSLRDDQVYRLLPSTR